MKLNPKAVNAPESNYLYTTEDLQTIYDYPHVLGHILGKDKLDFIHSKWIKYIWSRDRFLSLQAHRGSYKTTAVIEIGSIWNLLFNPEDRIFIIRKKFTDSAEVVETIVNMMLLPEAQELFYFVHGAYPKFKIKRKEKVTFSFKVNETPEGNLNAFGLDSALVGRHCDWALLDDFVGPRDRVSKAERETTKNHVREISTNIIDPGKPVRYIGTPWHKSDAWELCPKPIKGVSKFSINDINIISEEEKEFKRKTTTQSLFSANYLLEHVNDEGALFTEPEWGEWQTKGIESPRAHVDAAFDGDHFCALTIMARRSNGRVQAKGWTYPGNVKNWISEIVMIMKRHACRRIWVEDNPDKGWTADVLKEQGFSVTSYTETLNKHVKISTFLFEIWKDLIWAEDTDAEYMGQILDYQEKQEPEDAADSAASLVRACYSKRGGARSERWAW